MTCCTCPMTFTNRSRLSVSFTTASRRGKISEDYYSSILGHKKNQTQRYGSIPPKEYFENINKIEYALDFTRLKNEINNFYKI